MAINLIQRTCFASLLVLLLQVSGCASKSAGADLNRQASIAELEARIEALEKKINQALKQSATARIDASTALAIANAIREE